MGMKTKVLVLFLACIYVSLQLWFHLNYYGYSGKRIKNYDEGVQTAYPHWSSVFVPNYWKHVLAVFGGKLRGTNGPVLINSGKVIIYAKYRTGSTFTSQFFFEHQNISFMFEPLRLEAHPDQPMVEDGNAVLWDMLACNFETNETKRIHPWWMHYNVFCQITGQTPGCVHGQGTSPGDAWQHCDGAAIRVVKVIRIKNIWQLEEFLQQQVKIVHVIRDPRGIAHSRSSLHPPTEDGGQIDLASREYCQQAVDDLHYIRHQAYVDGRLVRHLYHIVRYEDLAMYPRREMEKLYRFIGASPDDKLLNWISKVEKNLNSNSQVSHGGQANEDFGTERADSASTAVAWRSSTPLTFSMVETIQRNCEEFMKLAGYLPFNNVRNLKNLSLPVLTHFDKGFIIKEA